MKRRLWPIVWVMVALLLSSCGIRGCDAGAQRTVASQEGTTPAPTEAAGEEGPSQPPPALAASDVILMDGELVSAYPSLELAFGGNTSGQLAALHVQLGQRVKEGDLIAVLDDTELRKAVEEAQIALDRAIEDKEKGEADIEKTYRRELEDAERKYERETHDAERKYQRELDDAQRALEKAQHELQQAKMQPPTTSVAEARTELAHALDREAEADDDYKQALDRPWDPQDIRDSLYKEWQARIVDRELAQLRLEDAQIALEVYYLDLQAKERDVENAETDLARVERDPVDKDIVEKEVNLTCDRAVEDAQRKLVQAQEDLEDARLYAPWDALVLSVDASAGSMVDSGAPVVTLLNIEDLYFVTQNLSERHVAQLHRGQRAEITLRAYPDTVLIGVVDAVIPQMERKSDSDARFVAYIRLEANELDLLPEMAGRVEVISASPARQ